MLDTQSVCSAAATCTFFHKCALDPSCYANIDLTTTAKVDNEVVSTMIQRAGQCFRSLKLGIVPGSSRPLVQTIRNSALECSGLDWLTWISGAPGALLRRLQLYNIDLMKGQELDLALSLCPSLLDLEIVGLNRVGLWGALDSVSNHCRSIEHLFIESSISRRRDSLSLKNCNALVENCPNLTSLALRGFKLPDDKVHVFVKGLAKLKYVDFSTSHTFTGAFLRNLGGSEGGNQLEVLILRDCMHLTQEEVLLFLTGVLAGDWKLLRHLDISNWQGLAAFVSEESDDRFLYGNHGSLRRICYSTSFLLPVEQLLEERPGFCLLAEFPTEESSSWSESSEDSSDDSSSDFSSPSWPGSHACSS